jgi:hypothetical protein
VIVADPTATAVTIPVAETMAMAGVLVAHVMARPASGFPLASSGVAVRVVA